MKSKNVEVPLTQGKVAIISSSDSELVLAYKWHARKKANTFYAVARKGPVHIYMHKLILQPGVGTICDHRNGDTLDNTRGNLRTCSPQENSRNKRVRKDNWLGLKGVKATKNGKRFIARISTGKERKYLGTYNTAEEAYAVYCAASKVYHKEFSNLGSCQN
mgnify:CR=1 FL=1